MMFLNRVLLATSLVWLIGWTLIVFRYGGEKTAPIGFGCYSTDACFAESNRSLLPSRALVYETGGYDGQFYYYIAAGMASGKSFTVDFLPFRLARIGYPLLTGWAYLLGPGALVYSMAFVPFLFHSLSIWLFYRMLQLPDWRDRLPGWKAGIWIYALNPISLKSFFLMVSDGLALSLGVAGLALFYIAMEGGGSSPARFAKFFFAQVFLGLALLSKETLLAIPAGFLAGEMLAVWRSGRLLPVNRYGWMRLAFWASTLLPLPLWWYLAGFHPGMAGERGGLPMAGLVGYLESPDAILSGRSFLVVLFFIYLAVAGRLVKEGMALTVRKEEKSSDSFYTLTLSFAMSLFLTSILISFATADEYWGNFANIVRIFGPGIPGLAWFAAGGNRGRSAFPLLFLGVFTLLLLVSEGKGTRLPTRVVETVRVDGSRSGKMEFGIPVQDSSSMSL